MFNPFIAAWNQRTDVLVLRYPQQQALDYSQLLVWIQRQLPVRPYILLAESFSGPLAISLASARPAAMVGLVLCCTFARCPRPLLRHLRALLPILPIAKRLLPVLGPLLFGSYRSAQLLTDLRHALQPVSAAVLRTRIFALLQVDVRPSLREIRVPTLVLQAGQDWLVPAARQQELLAALIDAQLVQITGPHLLLQTRPEAAATALQTWRTACVRKPTEPAATLQ